MMFDVRRVARRFEYVLRRSQVDRELAEEMRGHLEMAIAERKRAGGTGEEASLEAKRAFGSMLHAMDQARDVWVPASMRDLAQDARVGARLLVRNWLFTAVAVASLSLSIGFNTTMFAIVDGMSGGSAGLAEADTVVSVSSMDQGGRTLGVSYADFQDWARLARSFEGLGGYLTAAMTLTDPDRAPERVAGAYISSSAFSLLRERPILGRDFQPADDRHGAERVAILAASVWKSRYGADPDIVGRTIVVDGTPVTVIGVMRDGFRFPLVHDLWQPLANLVGLDAQARNARTLRVFGRLAPNLTARQAGGELTGITSELSKSFPATNTNIRSQVEPFLGRFALANPWNAMLLAVSIVTLIACANIANLLVSRATFRSGEIATRMSLGATRWRIARQLLTESALLAVMAAAFGLGVAVIGVRIWLASMPVADWPYWYHFAVSARVLAYLALISIGALLIFGLGPAWYVASFYPAEHLTNASRRGTAGRRSRRLAAVLLSIQVALTLSLLAGAGLLARTLLVVYRADSVVDTSRVVIAGVDLPLAKYQTPAQRIGFFDRLEQRVGATSLVERATVASGAPFYNAPRRFVTIQGQETDSLPAASYVVIGTRYFDTLGLPVAVGRVFTDADGTPGHESAIVNQLFASRYLTGIDPIGQRIRLSDPNRPDSQTPWLTIVGVSPTVREHYAQEFDPVVYVPYRLSPPPTMTLMVRTSARTSLLAPRLREEFRQLDSDLPLLDVRPLDWLVSGTRFANQVFAALFAIAAGLALLLAAMGLSVIVSQDIRRRIPEIGIRLALGARRRQLVWLFVRRVIGPLVCGLVAGLGGAFAVGRLVRGMLIQTSPSDPLTLVTISIVLTFIVLGAVLRPAYRAARLDPAAALHYE